MDRESAITHLQIIHTWAEFARERDLQFFTAKHLEDIAQWADDALELLNDDDTQLQYRDDHIAMYQAEIKRLEALLKEQERQLNEYHKADTFLAVHGFWSDNPPYGVKTSAELERP